MKLNLLFIATIISGWAHAQLEVGIEQYYYLQNNSTISAGPIAHIQSNNKWYAEVRYNYEELRTFSFYAGKKFSRENRFSYSVIPMAGGVVGRFNGASVGLHLDMDFEGLFLSSESQYTFSTQHKLDNFYFNWAELGYQPCGWLYAGAAMQHTYLFDEMTQNNIDLGMVIGFTFGNWTIPVYGFNPDNKNRFFVIGINWEWKKHKKT